MLFEEDGMLMGDNGHMYTLSTDEEGMWMAMYMMPDGRRGHVDGHVRCR
jgi:hypothetical protein